jgi:hypothetical protein
MDQNSTELKPFSFWRCSIWLLTGMAGGLVLSCALAFLAAVVAVLLGLVPLPGLNGMPNLIGSGAPQATAPVAAAPVPPTAAGAPAEPDEPLPSTATLILGTPTPTWTPKPTPTPTTTPTITPTPPGSTPVAVEAAEGWSFEGVRVQPGPELRWLLVYGEAVNQSGASQSVLGIQGTFYDAQGQPLTLDDYDEYWPMETLPDGGRMPFELTLYGPTAVDRVDLQISTEPGDEALRTDLEVTEVEGQENDENFCVAGQVRRPEPPLAAYAMVVAILYDADDRVINWGMGYEPANAFEGQEAVRMFACVERYNHVVARYELRAWGE